MFFIKECTNRPLHMTGKYFLRRYDLDFLCNTTEEVFIRFFDSLEELY